MDLVAIVIGIAIAILAGAVIVRPLSEYRPEQIREVDRKLSSVQAEQDRILNLIEELEMDHAIGKILDEDYETERLRLMQQGAENLKLIDELIVESLAENGQGEGERSLEEELEASVAKLRKKMVSQGQQYCSNCGEKVLVGDRFCVACGAKLSTQETER